ncbi:MAG: hypothetical protein H6Q16_1944 [Bacteroidetes bacterium]|nr:hypothetical protein [Bacteroidota bacterium]
MKTKHIFQIFILLLIASFSLQAQTTCPRGLVNCEGQCGRFVDENGNGICDPSELKPEETQTNAQNVLKIKKKSGDSSVETINLNDSISFVEDSMINDEDIVVEADVAEIVTHKSNKEKSLPQTEEENVKEEKPYRLVGISAITLICYLFTMLLVKFKVIRKIIHRKIWNTILLLTFLMSCLLGLILVIQLNYNVFQSIYLTNLKLHVEFGIAMTLISIIHILWHLPYFLKLFRNRKVN